MISANASENLFSVKADYKEQIEGAGEHLLETSERINLEQTTKVYTTFID